MQNRFLLVVLLVLLPVLCAEAQTFRVDSSVPAQGASDVGVNTTIELEFELPQDGRTWSVYEVLDFNTAFRTEPQAAIQRRSPQLLLNDAGRPAVITYDVTHSDGTDFTWLVYDVLASRPGPGGFVTIPMSEPFVLRYSTASTIGSQTISGVVVEGVPATRQLPAPAQKHLRDALAAVRAPSPSLGKVTAPTARIKAESDVTHVYLLTSETRTPNARQVSAATVLPGETGPFDLTYIRPGIYWPLVVQYEDVYQTRIQGIGFYDPDGDTLPDSLVVPEDGGDLSGVALLRFDYAAAPADAYLDAATQAATSRVANVALVSITSGGQALPEGLAYEWIYTFSTPDRSVDVVVTADPLGVRSSTQLGADDGRAFLPDLNVTSDQAVQTALSDGGTAFLENYLPFNVRTEIEAYELTGGSSPASGQPVWRVQFTGTNGFGTDTFERFIDAESGQVATSTDQLDDELPTQHLLHEVYPNPLQTEAQLRVSLPGAVQLQVEVVDLLGQVVYQYEQRQAISGTHVVPLSLAGQSAGVYLYRVMATSGNETWQASGRLVHVK